MFSFLFSALTDEGDNAAQPPRRLHPGKGLLRPEWHGAAPKTLRDPSPSSRIPSFAGGGYTSGSSGTEEQARQREPEPGV